MQSALRFFIALAGAGAHIAGQVLDAEGAQKALHRGEYRRAEQMYRSLLTGSPSSAELLSNLGVALHLQGKSSEAINVLRRALQAKELPGTLALLGVNYCKLRQAENARPILERAKRYFSDLQVLSVLGPCYLEFGAPLDAVAIFNKLVGRNAEPMAENMANLARAYFQASRYYVNLLERTGSREYLQAIQSARQNSSPNAREAFVKAFEEAPYIKPGMTVEELGTLLPQHERDPALLYVLGVTSGEQAIDTFLRCRERYATDVSVGRLHAEMLASQGREDEAVQEYDRLIGMFPAVPVLRHDLAMLFRKRREWDKALGQFEQERSLAPDDERSQVGISECLLHLNRYADLLRHLRPLLGASQPPQWALLDAADAERELGRIGAAMRALQRLVSLYPDNATAHYRLSRLYLLADQPRQAREQIEIFRRLRNLRRSADSLP